MGARCILEVLINEASPLPLPPSSDTEQSAERSTPFTRMVVVIHCCHSDSVFEQEPRCSTANERFHFRRGTLLSASKNLPRQFQNPPPSNILHFNFQTFRFHRNHPDLYKLFPPNIQQILTKIDRLRMNRRYMDPNHRTRNAISGSTLLYSYNRCQLVREVLPARQGERAY